MLYPNETPGVWSAGPIRIADWTPCKKGALLRLFTIIFSERGLRLSHCSLHEKDGQRWISLRIRTPDGWVSLLSFETPQQRAAFQVEVLAALDAHITVLPPDRDIFDDLLGGVA